MSKIPATKNAPAPKAPAQQRIEIASMEEISLWAMQIDDQLRVIGDLKTRLFNEVSKRQAYINSLAKEAA